MSMTVKQKHKTFLVYFHQVNQTYVEVKAYTRDEAISRGYRKWRREVAHASLVTVEEINPTHRRG
jgi:hypothetical protein